VIPRFSGNNQRYGGVVPPVTLALFHAKEASRQMLVDEAEGKMPTGILEGRNVSEDLLRGAADSGDATAEQSPALAAIALDAGAQIDQRDDVLKSTPLG
jgi:hypothetical protein